MPHATVSASFSDRVSSAEPSSIDDGDWGTGPEMPFQEGSYAKALGRPRGSLTFPDVEWDAHATEEERFTALKAAIDEGFRDVDEGRYIEISSPEQLREMLRNAGETARSKVQPAHPTQYAAAL